MSDFASSAMMRVLAQGLRELGLDPGDPAADTRQARVSLRQKQALVASAVAQGGLACLPLLGRGLRRFAHEPTHLALASARSARELFERWQRLERYIHSRHRCVIESCEPGQAQLRHVALGAGPGPSAAEDLVVAGVLAALLEAIGLRRVELHVGEASAWPVPQPQALDVAARRGATARWRFRWEGSPIEAAAAQHTVPAPGLGPDPAWPECAQAGYLRLVQDLALPIGLPALAADLHLPVRTLQRRLAEAGLSYRALLAEARCRTGAWRLLHTADPIAEVGFLSGFADQPHFSRELQRRVGMPPAAYRAAFGGASAGGSQAASGTASGAAWGAAGAQLSRWPRNRSTRGSRK